MKQKNVRYYWWLVRKYIHKHAKILMLSFFMSVLLMFAVVSFSSYLDAFLFPKRQIIGIVAPQVTPEKLPQEVLEKISSGLVYVDEKGIIRPAVADHWETKNNNKEFIFHLKKGIFWDDGGEVLAKDIQYKFPDVRLEVIDDHTVRFKLKSGLAIFPTLLSRPVIKAPASGVLGRYKISNLQYKDGYVEQATLVPQNEQDVTLIYRFYETENDLRTAYKLGEVRQMTVYDQETAKEFESWKNSTVEKNDDFSIIMTLFFNTQKGLLTEKDARQAIAYAIAREPLKQHGELANGPLAPTSWAYDTSAKTIQYDLEFAQKKIQKMVSATESAKLNLVTFYEFDDIASSLKENLKDISIDVDVRFNDYESLENFDMLLSYWRVPNDPDQYFFWHSTQPQSNNISGLKSVKIDKLLEDGRNANSTKARQAIYFQYQKIMLDETPAVFLYYPKAYTVTRK